MDRAEVGDIVELSCLGGAFMFTGEVVETFRVSGQDEILVESHTVRPGERLCFSQRHVSRVISRGSDRDALESIIDEIIRG